MVLSGDIVAFAPPPPFFRETRGANANYPTGNFSMPSARMVENRGQSGPYDGYAEILLHNIHPILRSNTIGKSLPIHSRSRCVSATPRNPLELLPVVHKVSISLMVPMGRDLARIPDSRESFWARKISALDRCGLASPNLGLGLEASVPCQQ